MFKGAHVTIMRVVEQLRAGVPLSEITEDYPKLNSAAQRLRMRKRSPV